MAAVDYYSLPPSSFLSSTPRSHSSHSEEPPNPHLHRAAFPLYTSLCDSPEYKAAIARLPTTNRHGSQHYQSYRDDTGRRRPRNETPSYKKRSALGGRESKSSGVVTSPTATEIRGRERSLPPLPKGTPKRRSRSAGTIRRADDTVESPSLDDGWIAVATPLTPVTRESKKALEREMTVPSQAHLLSAELFKFESQLENEARKGENQDSRGSFPLCSTGASPAEASTRSVSDNEALSFKRGGASPGDSTVQSPSPLGALVSTFSYPSPSIQSHNGPFADTLGSLKRMLSTASRAPRPTLRVGSRVRGWSRAASSGFDASFVSRDGISGEGGTSRRSSFYVVTPTTGSEPHAEQHGRTSVLSRLSVATLPIPYSHQPTTRPAIPTVNSTSILDRPRPVKSKRKTELPPSPFLYDEIAHERALSLSPPPPRRLDFRVSSPLELPPLTLTTSRASLPEPSLVTVTNQDGTEANYWTYGARWETKEHASKSLGSRKTKVLNIIGSSRGTWKKWMGWIDERRRMSANTV